MLSETCVAPVNIAVIKYWGKRDEALILPINDSFSMTLSTDQMCAKTTVAVSPEFKENKLWLNGQEVDFNKNKRLASCIKALKRMALASVNNVRKFPLDWKMHICSENNFPTAAGLASSAAGYACLVYTLASIYGIETEELSQIARLGSGSACRSIYGGFVQWHAGTSIDGSDSLAIQTHPSLHWPEMHVLILVVNDARKKIGSTKGMQNSVNTSEFLKYRAERFVPQRIKEIKEAVTNKDFRKFAEITMKDSNQFHAICLDTYPPCVYMNDISHLIVEFVHNFNELRNDRLIAYTFDAGPNACLYLLENEVANAIEAINEVFPNEKFMNVEYLKGIPVTGDPLPIEDLYPNDKEPYPMNLLKYIIHTKIGEGPQKLAAPESLLNDKGLPKKFL